MTERPEHSEPALFPEPDASGADQIRDSADRSGETLFVAASYSGSLPPPRLLAEFDKVQPGLAERIVGLVERQAAHRQDLERRTTDAEIEDMRAGRIQARWGQVFGLVIGMTAIIAGAITSAKGAQFAGGAIGAGGVIGLVGVFVLGRYPAARRAEESPKSERPDGREAD